MLREAMPMQGMHEEEVILAGTIVEVGVVDIGSEGHVSLCRLLRWRFL
jgi:hypothetical protein